MSRVTLRPYYGEPFEDGQDVAYTDIGDYAESLLKREEAIECLNFQNEKFFGGQSEALKMAISALSDMNPNIYAHWESIGKAFQCSRCGTLCAVTETATHTIYHIEDKFCRGCGAHMRPEPYKAEKGEEE